MPLILATGYYCHDLLQSMAANAHISHPCLSCKYTNRRWPACAPRPVTHLAPLSQCVHTHIMFGFELRYPCSRWCYCCQHLRTWKLRHTELCNLPRSRLITERGWHQTTESGGSCRASRRTVEPDARRKNTQAADGLGQAAVSDTT